MPASPARGPADAPSVVVLGAGRQALETAGYCAELGVRIAYFLDECGPSADRDPSVFGAPALAFGQQPVAPSDLLAITAVGSPEVRRRFVARWPATSYLTLISSHAWLAADVSVGLGATVCPRACLNRLVQVGAHTLVNVAAVLSHDVEVGDFVTIGPGCVIGGGARIATGAFLGIGSTVRDHVSIGSGAVVAAGAVVVEDVMDGATVIGVPARPRAVRTVS
jgi:sugar O-acyltransferase (sialic acid O-acetyltransferase NeuD family)